MKECPCGSVFPYTDCCGLLIRGAIGADTAEDLMRSRYTAHVVKEWDYLVQTRHPDERKDLKDLATANEGVEWKKLEILHSQKGGRGDDEGEVTYVATFEKNGKTIFKGRRTVVLLWGTVPTKNSASENQSVDKAFCSHRGQGRA